MTKFSPLILPSLRGSFGSWIYYSCLMPIRELGARTHYAEELHPNKALSELIQRSLEDKRAAQIADYLKSTQDRFFNSLVLATYKGAPEWLELGNLRSSKNPELVTQATKEALETIGFLRLSGAEKIFAIDGQHRLAGIKRAIEKKVDLESDTAPVLIVGHKEDAEGMRRSRRLFTTLNKTAIKVKKRDIIALDEDDVMAITARRLVESNPAFKDPKIAVISSESLPATNRTALTTIANLYDVLKLIFSYDAGPRSDTDLRFNRPSDERLEHFHSLAVDYFSAIGGAFPPVGRLFKARQPSKITERYRGPQGGHVLFRPVGLDVMTRAAILYSKAKKVSAVEAVRRLRKVPVDLARPPYVDVLWDPQAERMIVRGKTLAVRLVCHMVGLGPGEVRGLNLRKDELQRDYREFVGRPVNLP